MKQAEAIELVSYINWSAVQNAKEAKALIERLQETLMGLTEQNNRQGRELSEAVGREYRDRIVIDRYSKEAHRQVQELDSTRQERYRVAAERDELCERFYNMNDARETDRGRLRRVLARAKGLHKGLAITIAVLCDKRRWSAAWKAAAKKYWRRARMQLKLRRDAEHTVKALVEVRDELQRRLEEARMAFSAMNTVPLYFETDIAFEGFRKLAAALAGREEE